MKEIKSLRRMTGGQADGKTVIKRVKAKQRKRRKCKEMLRVRK